MIDSMALPALLQLASSGLPIGGFSYSSGLESAVNCGLVHDSASAAQWIESALLQCWAVNEARVWLALNRAWAEMDGATLEKWNDWLIATRDTSELRLETSQSGRSLVLWLLKLEDLPRLDEARRQLLEQLQPIAYPCAHALAAWCLDLNVYSGLHALGWSLLEAQTSAAVRLVPLGQTQGQQILRSVGGLLPDAVQIAQSGPAEQAKSAAPMLSILSAQHEVQYSRLFRS